MTTPSGKPQQGVPIRWKSTLPPDFRRDYKRPNTTRSRVAQAAAAKIGVNKLAK